jgi:hypothetical protein
MPARVWVWITQPTSGRAPCTALWITKPARWMRGGSRSAGTSTSAPSRSIFASEDAVISSNARPNGFNRKWSCGPGTRAEMCV